MAEDADVIVVGGGLAGAGRGNGDRRRRQARHRRRPGRRAKPWRPSLLVVRRTLPGGFAEQRRLGIKDSYDLALQDWMGTAGFDREDDLWPSDGRRPMSRSAAGEKRDWLRAMGHRIFPVVGWAERGGYDAMGHGNSVPRFHVTWGTGPGIVEPFERRAREAAKGGQLILNSAIASMRSPSRRRGRWSQRRHPRAHQRRARQELVAQGGRRIFLARASGGRRLRRHRRQSRAGAAELAEAPRRAAKIHDLRRARTCRRPHDRDHRGRRRAADQPRPHVALCRGHPELESDLAAPWHPHPAWSVVDVVRRHGQAPARAAVPRLRHARAAALHHAAPATIIPGSS